MYHHTHSSTRQLMNKIYIIDRFYSLALRKRFYYLSPSADQLRTTNLQKYVFKCISSATIDRNNNGNTSVLLTTRRIEAKKITQKQQGGNLSPYTEL